LWIPVPGFGVSTDVVVFCGIGVVAVVDEPALAVWVEPPPPPQAAMSRAAVISQPPSTQPRRRPFKT